MGGLDDAWDALHSVVPTGWYVGRPSYHDERREWQQYAFDPSERAKLGIRSREWTAVAATEEAVVREMARGLREIGGWQGAEVAFPVRVVEALASRQNSRSSVASR